MVAFDEVDVSTEVGELAQMMVEKYSLIKKIKITVEVEQYQELEPGMELKEKSKAVTKVSMTKKQFKANAKRREAAQ